MALMDDTAIFLLGKAAYDNYRDVTNSPANENTAFKFYRLLGVIMEGEDRNKAWKKVKENEESIRRIKILTGPHARTYIKAWLIQNDGE